MAQNILSPFCKFVCRANMQFAQNPKNTFPWTDSKNQFPDTPWQHNKRSVKRIPCVSISPAANKSKNQENILKSTTFYNKINLREQSSPADNKPPFYADDFCKNMQKFSAFFISAKAGKNIYVGMYCSGYLLALPVISTLGIRIAGMATPGKNKRLPV